jgi:hypothetical protein
VSYCFRIRFHLPDRLNIDLPDNEVVLNESPERGERVVLRARGERAIREAHDLVVIGKSYASESEAEEAGTKWQATLQKGFAHANIGADFGARAPQSVVTEHGLRYFGAQMGKRVLSDAHGLMVFECDPWPKFIGFGAKATGGVGGARVVAAIRAAAHIGVGMSDRESLAYDLYSASFSQPSADARFVMLMMAVETLLEPKARSAEAVAHVESMIAATKQSGLPKGEIDSIAGTLSWVREESIGQAGRRLARSLGNRRYMDEEPARFFTRCYELRSQLVHGHYPRPTMSEVSNRMAQLELFVSHLLSVQLLDELAG